MKGLSFVVAAIASLWVVPAVAHHSFAAEYNADQPVTLRGKLTKIEWINPHGWLHIEVAEPDGRMVNWDIELNSPNVLTRQGLRKTHFTIGSELVVEGFRAKNGSRTANGRSVKFADGRDFFVGASSRDAPGPDR